MKQVYVYFEPILVDVPDNVHNALNLGGRDNASAEIVCVEAAITAMSKIQVGNAKVMAMAMLSRVVKA